MDVNPDGLEATRSEILASGGEAVACPCDVSDESAVKAAVMQAMDAYGRIDILVNVAGVQITKLLADTTKADYDKMMDINLGGKVPMTHQILPIMKNRAAARSSTARRSWRLWATMNWRSIPRPRRDDQLLLGCGNHSLWRAPLAARRDRYADLLGGLRPIPPSGRSCSIRSKLPSPSAA